MPFVFVGDDAFPLVERILKPFTPPRGGHLANEEKNFNYRLSRARRCVEILFGILTAKFICLVRPLLCSPERAQKIVSTCCVLHNYFLRTNTNSYCPPTFTDRYDANGHLIGGAWRRDEMDMTHLDCALLRAFRAGEQAKRTREIFKEFVILPEGSPEFQRRAVFIE